MRRHVMFECGDWAYALRLTDTVKVCKRAATAPDPIAECCCVAAGKREFIGFVRRRKFVMVFWRISVVNDNDRG